MAREELYVPARGGVADKDAEHIGRVAAGVDVADAGGLAEVGPREVVARAVIVLGVAVDGAVAAADERLVCTVVWLARSTRGKRGVLTCDLPGPRAWRVLGMRR